MFVSLTVDAAVDCQSVTDCDVEESAPAPYWPCHIPLSPMLQYICPPPIHPSTHSFPFMCLPPDFKCLSLHFLQAPPPPPIWSPQKRLIQEGWAGVSELLLLCPMRCFHSTFLLLCCFYGPDMLTVQVAQSDVIQLYQAHKGCLFRSLRGRGGYLELCCHSRQFFLKWRNKQRKSVWQITGAGRSFYIRFCFAESAHT